MPTQPPVVTFHPQPQPPVIPVPPLPPGFFTPIGAMFFALMPGDNAAPVAAGGAVQFPQNGPNYGPTPPTRTGPSSFQILTAGTYEVSFQASTTEAGALQLWAGPAGLTPVPESTCRRATGTSIVSNTVLLGLQAGDIISVRNPSSQATAQTLTPAAGGEAADPTSATLTIVRVG
jgi:hypothetical protein